MGVVEDRGRFEPGVGMHVVGALYAEYGNVSAFAFGEAIDGEVLRIVVGVVGSEAQFRCDTCIFGHSVGSCNLVVGPSGHLRCL